MNKFIFCSFLICFIFISGALRAQNEWRHRACLPSAGRGNVAQFSVGNKGYLVCGYEDVPGTAVNEVWEYDPSTNIWTQKGNYPHVVNGVSVFVINDTAYAGLGYDQTSTFYNDFYRYDEAGDQWIPIASFPGAARYTAMEFAINGKGYVGCGFNGGELSDFYEYDPVANTWTAKANFPGSARQSGLGVANSTTAIMGLGGISGGSTYSDIYSYNPTSDSWTQISSYAPSGRSDIASFVLNDTIYAVAGGIIPTLYSDCWRYDVPSNTWIQEANFACIGPVRKIYSGGFVINGHGYVACGRNISFTADYNDLLEFGPRDTAFVKRVHVIGNDTSYCGNFSQTLSTGNPCTLWSTGVSAAQIIVTTPGTYWAYWADTCAMVSDTIHINNGQPSNSFLGNDTSYCGNFSRVLNSGNANTNWSTGAIGSQITVTAPGTYWASYNSSCGLASDTIYITQNALPIINLGNDTSICNSQTEVINAGNPGSTYNWSTGAQTQTISVTSADNYSVTVTNSSGCSMWDSISVSVDQLKDSLISTNASCNLNNGYITVIVQNGNSPYSYSWNNSDTTSSIDNLPSGNYDVTVTDARGCTVISGATIISTGAPSVQISATLDTICSGDTAKICATSGFASYEWNIGDTSTCIQTSDAGNYYVTAYEAANCSAISNQVTITIRPPTPITVSVNGDTLTCYQAVSYQWYFDGNILVGDTMNVLIAPQSGIYEVRISDINGCYYRSSSINVISGITNLEDIGPVILFPNPTSGNVEVKFSKQINPGSAYKIMAVDGAIVQDGIVFENMINFSMEAMADGVYLFQIIDQAGVLISKRFIVFKSK